MRWFRKLRRRRELERDLEDELAFHVEQSGRARFGNATSIREKCREVWTFTALESCWRDVRYAVRTMSRNRMFTVLAALSLALGIGANTAIYSFMDALWLRPLPVPRPESLVVLNWHLSGTKTVHASVVHNESGSFDRDPKTGITTGIFPYPAFELLRKSRGAASVVFAYHPAETLNVVTDGQAEAVSGEYVSGEFFTGLEVAPAAGRLIFAEDDRPGAAGVAVVSYGFARRRFGDAASAAGRAVTINNQPFTVIGVTPAGFFGVDPASAPDIFLPMHADLLIDRRATGARYLDDHDYWIEIMARLRTGVAREQAGSALAGIFEPWVAATATNDTERRNLPEFLLKDGSGGLDNLRREYSEPMFLLLAMAGLILAIACANLANLLLARATVRRREMAVRLSIGAGRGRVIRQLLTESLLLAVLGGAMGMVMANWGMGLLERSLQSGSDPFTLRPELNWHVLGAAAALSLITAVPFGLAPALQATRVEVLPALKEMRGEVGLRGGVLRFGARQALAVSQMAVSLLLLVAAGLFVRTLENLRSREMGFRRDNILVFTLNAGQAGHRAPEIFSFYQNLKDRFAGMPGVESAALANSPLIGDGAWGWAVVPLGKELPESAPTGHGSGMAASATRVLATGAGFFRTMQIPIVAGREFSERDRAGSPPVAIVNEAWVKVNLDGGNPVGRRVVSYGLRKQPRELEIVGLAKNVRYGDFRGDFPAIVYLPFEQDTEGTVQEMTFFLRTAADPLASAGAARELVRGADSRIPVTKMSTQSAAIDAEMVEEAVFAKLSALFAMLALTTACVGLYGTMSYTVARRTREIGIRIALGAGRGGVLWMVIRQALAMTIVGAAVGIPVAYACSRVVQALLYGIQPNDPETMAASLGVLTVVALAAGLAPARRASRIDPMTALRDE